MNANDLAIISLATKLVSGEETFISREIFDAKLRLQQLLDDSSLYTATPRTLAEASEDLQVPIENYIDFFDDGEKVVHIHHYLSRKPEEALFTTKGIIFSGAHGRIKRLYAQMVNVLPRDELDEAGAFVSITIELDASSDEREIEIHHVPVDSPIFSFLKQQHIKITI